MPDRCALIAQHYFILVRSFSRNVCFGLCGVPDSYSNGELMMDDSLAPGNVRGRSKHDLSQDVTSFDSGAVFLVKALFYPVTAVALLALCLWAGNRSFTGSNFLIAVLTFAGAAEFLGDSRVDHDVPALHQEFRWLLDILVRWIAIGACVALVLYLSGLSVTPIDSVVVVWFVLTPAVLWSGTIGMRQLLLYVGIKHMQPRRAVIVGVNKQGLFLSKMIQEQPLLRIELLGFFEDRRVSRLPERPLPLLGRMGDVAEFVRTRGVNVVYITLPISPRPGVLKLLHALRDTVASVYFVPDLHSLNNIQARVDVVHGIPMIAVYESPFFGVRSLAKRVSDIILSGLVLISLSPVLIAVAIGVRRSSEGPIIFKQRRYGLDGREIMVYKFRSMTVTEDGASSYTQVTRGDSRVTPFGAFIRRTSLDELPQLLNVLEGSMSVVGPRPHAIAVNEHYRGLIPSYMFRHKVKPGITGWAQVNGYRGGDDLHTMTKRIEFDLDYLKNWSIWFDLRIILRTVLVLWGDRDAY
jgi:putative colanic acid biosysnthesis UDP-glucose lipid carrier transferase